MYAIRSYYDKLSGIEENATVGADWQTNVSNKPTKLSDFENDLGSPQVGADWNSNLQNIPSLLTEFRNNFV